MDRTRQRLFAAALPLLLTACGNSLDSGDSGLSVAITDAPACGFDHVYVTVLGVRVNESTAADDNDPGWKDITPPAPQKIDLLSLSNGLMQVLGQAHMPAADYRQLRLELAGNTATLAANTIVPSGGATQVLDTLSMAKDGLTLITPITIRAGAVTEVVLDFDVCRSVVQRGDGSYALRPAISVTQMHASAGIAGYVDPANAGASVYAEVNGTVIKGTRADSAGHFVLAPVPAGDDAGMYDVVIAQDGHATAVVTGVPVTAGATTLVATAAAAIALPPAAMHAASGTVLPASALATVYGRQIAGNRYFATTLVNANADTGAWTLSLAAAAPLVAPFGPLPLAFSTDTADAGHYLLSVVPVVGTSENLPADISAGDATGMDTSF